MYYPSATVIISYETNIQVEDIFKNISHIPEFFRAFLVSVFPFLVGAIEPVGDFSEFDS
jgi:hypothetical protein